MTIEDFTELKKAELAKLAALEKILKILAELENETDDEAVEWVKEKIAE